MTHYNILLWKQESTRLSTEKQIKDFFLKLNIIGKKIKSIKILGWDYDHDRVGVEDLAFRQLEKVLSEEQAKEKAKYSNIPKDLMFYRIAEVDEPIVIELNDGRRLEILILELDNIFYADVNKISPNATWDINSANVDGNVMFSPCVGQTIKAVEFPIHMHSFGQEEEYQQIPDVLIRLENGTGLKIEGWLDFCDIECVDSKNQPLKISFEDLKKGLHNKEDE
ncbi:hypothetical protein [Candidatus Avelusimicrobium sp.]